MGKSSGRVASRYESDRRARIVISGETKVVVYYIHFIHVLQGRKILSYQ